MATGPIGFPEVTAAFSFIVIAFIVFKWTRRSRRG